MKHFNEKHESVTEYWFKPTITDGVSQGDIVPHRKIAENTYFYQRQFVDNYELFVKVYISKEMILELAEQIKNIETQIVDMPFDELPF